MGPHVTRSVSVRFAMILQVALNFHDYTRWWLHRTSEKILCLWVAAPTRCVRHDRWFQICFMFIPEFWKMIQFDEHIFLIRVGWNSTTNYSYRLTPSLIPPKQMKFSQSLRFGRLIAEMVGQIEATEPQDIIIGLGGFRGAFSLKSCWWW